MSNSGTSCGMPLRSLALGTAARWAVAVAMAWYPTTRFAGSAAQVT